MNFRMHVEEQLTTCAMATALLLMVTPLSDLTTEHLGRETMIHSHLLFL